MQESEVSNVLCQFIIYFQLFVGDGLPAQVCEPCVRLVNTSYKFKEQCETADTALRQYLSTHSLQVAARNLVNLILLLFIDMVVKGSRRSTY